MKGIFTPLSGAVAQERVLEVLSNNLANLNTTGFKGDSVTFEVLNPEPEKNYKTPLPPANYKVNFDDLMPLIGNEIKYVGVSGIERDLTQGPVINTRNKTDLMIEGKGYFTVMTTEGVRYTRDGSFSLNSDGVLTNKAGHPIQGEKGSIYLRSGQFDVNHLGEVYQDGQLIDRLLIVDIPDARALERAGGNLLIFGGTEDGIARIDAPVIRQGQLEGSNVNAIKSMTSLIMAHRSFEAYQRAVKNYDSMMEKSSNTIGEVRA